MKKSNKNRVKLLKIKHEFNVDTFRENIKTNKSKISLKLLKRIKDGILPPSVYELDSEYNEKLYNSIQKVQKGE